MPVKMKREQGRRTGNENQCKARGELSIMVLGRSQGVLGGAWEAPKTDDVFSERLGRVLGGLGWFWCSEVVLGSDLGGLNVVISLI